MEDIDVKLLSNDDLIFSSRNASYQSHILRGGGKSLEEKITLDILFAEMGRRFVSLIDENNELKRKIQRLENAK